ncbi:OmpA family protein [bacterium]|nr:OmpA family protein [bacterium]MBU1957297.1 OmpA family protein [bacterium]
MNSKMVIIAGLIASLLLIFLCIFFNAQRYYKELALGTTNTSLISTSTLPLETIETTITKPIETKEENIEIGSITTVVSSDINQSFTVPKETKPLVIKETLEVVQEEINTLLKHRQINFKKNSGHITLESQKVLDEVATALAGKDDVLIEVQGHTDAGGKAKVNRSISQMRANKVKVYLIKKGLKGEHIRAKGFGETKPLSTVDPKNILNRRVEIYVTRR